MAIYVGVLEMHAGEDKTIQSSPPDDVTDPPDISDWTLEARCTWTDGSAGFTKDENSFAIATPDWTLTLDSDDTDGMIGRRLEFHVWRIDAGFETELDWGFINVLR